MILKSKNERGLHKNVDGLSRILIKRKCSNEKCPDCNFEDTHFGIRNLNPEVKAEWEEFPDKESLHSDWEIYPIEAVNISEISTWAEIWGPYQIKEWQDEDNNIGKFKRLKSTLENKPNR